MKKVCFLLLCTLLFVTLTLPAFAISPTVFDPADLLNDQEEEKLDNSQSNCPDHGINYYFLTSRSFSAPSNREVIDQCGIGSDEDAIVLVVRLVNSVYYYDLYTFNEPDRIFSQEDVDAVLDAEQVYTKLKGGKLIDGAHSFYHQCSEVVSNYYFEQAEKEARRPLMSLIVGIVVGVLAGGGAVLGVFLYYRRKQHGESYPLDRYARMDLTESHDRFVGSFVTRVRVQSSNGGSGGGGGRPSGGHRGGR